MVQGWESRAHLANKRREEARERKQSKKGPQRLSGEAVLQLLIKSDLLDLRGHSLEAWLSNEAGGKALCYAYFRAEACQKHKRCKFSHEFTVSVNKGHSYDESSESLRSEPHMDCYLDLQSIPAKEYKNLNLLFLNKMCIYDRSDPVVWQKWYEQTNSKKQSSETGLQTITEADSVVPDDFSVMSLETTDNGEDIDTKFNLSLEDDQKASSTCEPCFLNSISSPLLNEILAFVNDVDFCYLCATSLTMKRIILAEEFNSHRRRNYLQSITPTGKELSKLRKNEKKKKLKQANLKDTSKKGHKAVKVCRR